jgi:hypothetical protein
MSPDDEEALTKFLPLCGLSTDAEPEQRRRVLEAMILAFSMFAPATSTDDVVAQYRALARDQAQQNSETTQRKATE